MPLRCRDLGTHPRVLAQGQDAEFKSHPVHFSVKGTVAAVLSGRRTVAF